jgi:signal transduction histidine kinase
MKERTLQVPEQSDSPCKMANKLSHAEQKERQRLVGILHDHIQPLIVGARMQLWEIQRKKDIDGIQKTTAKIETILEQALTALRSLSSDLGPSMHLNSGLRGGLRSLISYMKKNFRFKVSLFIDNDLEPVLEETGFLLFECVKDLLLNIVRHAGIRHASLFVRRSSDERINIIISDKDKGFDFDPLKPFQIESTSPGLFCIRKRLLSIGGQIAVESSPGLGTRITLTVPAGENR